MGAFSIRPLSLHCVASLCFQANMMVFAFHQNATKKQKNVQTLAPLCLVYAQEFADPMDFVNTMELS